MARIFFLILLILSLGCSKDHSNSLGEWVKQDGKLRILATTAIVQDLVQQVGGEYVKVISVINGDQDPHSYEIVKGDGEKFVYADLIFANGLMLEHSASMQQQLKEKENVVFLGEEILKKYPDQIIYVQDQLDPHIWMDISLWSGSIDLVLEKLVEVDPGHQTFYQSQAKTTKEAFLQKDLEIKKMMQVIPENKRYLVTSHDAFNYYVKRYFATPKERENGDWRVRMQALQGLAPDEQISVLQIKDIVNHICQYDIEVIFPESNLSQDSLEKVKEGVEKRGKEVRLSKSTLYGDTLGGKTYLEMMQYDANVLETNLNEPS